MDVKQQLLQIVSEAAEQPRWAFIGDLIAFAAENVADRDKDAAALRLVTAALADAGDAIGPNQLGKIARVHRFLTELGRRDSKYAPKQFGGASIVALEIAHRLYALDEACGLAALDQILAGAGVAKVDALYRDAKMRFKSRLSSKSVAFLDHQAVVEAAIDIVEKNAALFIGLNQPFSLTTKPHRSDAGVVPDFVARLARPDKTSDYDGFEIFRAPPHKSFWWRYRPQAVFNATFFRRFWLFYAGDAELGRFIASHLTKLRVANLGVVLLSDDQRQFEILSVPTGGPEPDRRDLL